MECEDASLLGSVLMALGSVVMMDGIGYSTLNRLPQFDLPQFFAHGAVFSILVSGVLWLADTRVGRHGQISDRYWWMRHYDKHYRRGDTNHQHN